MAFQNVGTPRFFVNDALFCIKSGYGLDDIAVYDDSATTELNETIFEMNPSYQITKSRNYGYIIAPRSNTLNYIAYLGHTFATSGTTVYNFASTGELYGDNGNVNFLFLGLINHLNMMGLAYIYLILLIQIFILFSMVHNLLLMQPNLGLFQLGNITI